MLIGGLLAAFFCDLRAHVISPRQLIEVVDFGAPVVSPDGSMVAYRVEKASVERNTYDTVWYVQSMEGVPLARRVADGGVPLRESWGSPVASSPVWAPDGRWIYFRALLDGRTDVWRAAADGSGAEPVTNDAADVREFRLSPDGGVLQYSVGATRDEVLAAEQGEYDRGIRIDRSVPIGQSLFRSGYLEGRMATQRLRDNEVTRYPLLAGVSDRWKEVDLGTGAKRELSPSEVPLRPLTMADLPQGIGGRPWKLAQDPLSTRTALLMHVDEWDGLSARPDVELAMLRDATSRQPVRCHDELCTGKPITGIQWRPGTDDVVFTTTDTNESQAQSIFRWNVRTGEVHAVAHFQGLASGGRDPQSSCGISSIAMACAAEDATRPPRLERIELESGRRRILFDPNAVLASDMATTPVRLLRWTDSKGQSFNGQYYPASREGDAPPPLFITYYRCSGFVRGGAGDEWPLATLAALGVSALCINAAPTRLDAVERYEFGRSAVESVVDLLGSRGEIDREKIGMGGLSFGTEVTMWTVMNSDVLSAASVSSPPFTPLAYLFMSMHGDAFFSRLRKVWQLGAPDETVEQWKRLSPTFNLHRIRAPILMQMPEQEYSYTLDYAIPLLRERRADLYVYPNEPHIKFQPKHQLAVYERNVDWFRFWLQDFEDPDPGKLDQYEHWRSMRLGTSADGAKPAASRLGLGLMTSPVLDCAQVDYAREGTVAGSEVTVKESLQCIQV